MVQQAEVELQLLAVFTRQLCSTEVWHHAMSMSMRLEPKQAVLAVQQSDVLQQWPKRQGSSLYAPAYTAAGKKPWHLLLRCSAVTLVALKPDEVMKHSADNGPLTCADGVRGDVECATTTHLQITQLQRTQTLLQPTNNSPPTCADGIKRDVGCAPVRLKTIQTGVASKTAQDPFATQVQLSPVPM
jgi:hypothetical protein